LISPNTGVTELIEEELIEERQINKCVDIIDENNFIMNTKTIDLKSEDDNTKSIDNLLQNF